MSPPKSSAAEKLDTPAPINITCEVQQHLGEGRVRTVSMLIFSSSAMSL